VAIKNGNLFPNPPRHQYYLVLKAELQDFVPELLEAEASFSIATVLSVMVQPFYLRF
jgi:hypothetical protein